MTPFVVQLGACALGSGILLAAPSPPPRSSWQPSTSCTVASDVPITSSLRAAIDRWWSARERRDLRTAYEQYESRYRASETLEEYSAGAFTRDRFDIRSHCVRSVEYLDDASALVRVDYMFVFPPARVLPGTVEENWVREGDRWLKKHLQPRIPLVNDPSNRDLEGGMPRP